MHLSSSFLGPSSPTMVDYEKQQAGSVSSGEGKETVNVEESYVDPEHDTLHRGLSARQISMIAVSTFNFHLRCFWLNPPRARRCCRDRFDHWFGNRSCERRPVRHIPGLFVRWYGVLHGAYLPRILSVGVGLRLLLRSWSLLARCQRIFLTRRGFLDMQPALLTLRSGSHSAGTIS